MCDIYTHIEERDLGAPLVDHNILLDIIPKD